MLAVLDASGRFIEQRPMPVGAQQLRLDLSSLPGGLYWVQWKNVRGTAVRRVVKR